MKKILLVLLLNLAVFIISFPHSALAADTVNGAKLFDTNCAACHRGGRNLIVAAKTLKKSDLEKYNMSSIEAIVNQVKNGKNAMPAFKNRLNDKQIEEVAAYVLEQAEKDWS